MAFVTVPCPDSECHGVVVLGIDEYGSIFGKGAIRQSKEGKVKLPCPLCERDITVAFEHVGRG